jgi:hypothetical protein
MTAVDQIPPGTAQTAVEQIRPGEALAGAGQPASGTEQAAVKQICLVETCTSCCRQTRYGAAPHRLL